MAVKSLWSTVCVVGAVLLAGCSAANNANSPQSSLVSATTSSLVTGNANIFSLIGGGTIDVSRGTTSRPMAMWFWAPG
jgi:hypothetical protein